MNGTNEALEPRSGGRVGGDPSALMLRMVLEGATYEAVGEVCGLSRTAVERRVKSLAGSLCRDGRVAGLSDTAVGFVRRLRAAQGELLRALEAQRTAAPAPALGTPPRVVSDDEVADGLHRILRRSAEPSRDAAMFCLLFMTGVRPLEVARLRVRDYLLHDGRVRRASELPAEASISGRARPLYFASERLDDLLGQYLAERLARRHGCSDDPSFRRLHPDSALFLTAGGDAFPIAVQGVAPRQRYLCRLILEAYRRIFRVAGLADATPTSVRRTVAARLLERGADEDQVRLVLGLNDRRAVRELCRRVRPDIASLVRNLV